MKTKSIRAKTDDAILIEQASRELAAKLQRQVTVSEVIHGLMEYIEYAKERIESKTTDSRE